jgi:hypothetical protein
VEPRRRWNMIAPGRRAACIADGSLPIGLLPGVF